MLSVNQDQDNAQAFLQTNTLDGSADQCLTFRANIGNTEQGYVEFWNQDYSPLWQSGDG